MSNWPLITLKEAGIVLIDCDHKTPKGQESGFPYIGIPQLKNGRIIQDGARLISEADFHHWRRKALPMPNDIILSRRCNPGVIAYVPDDLDIALGQNLVLLRSDGKQVYPPFLRWITQGRNWWNQVNTYINVGAVFESLKCADIPKFEFMLPPMEEQKRIAKTLGDLDRKIEVNQKTNQTLEQIAQAIFKSWFVDFEPVKAKNAAREALLADNQSATEEQIAKAEQQAAINAISGAGNIIPTEQLQTLVDLFPNQLVESELGEIPQGWSVTEIKALSEKVSKGTTPRKKDMESAEDLACINFLKVRDISDCGEISTGSLDLIPKSVHEGVLKRSMLEVDDVIFSIAGTIGRTSVITKALAGSNCNQAVAFIRLKNSDTYRDFIYLLLKTPGIQELVESKLVQGVQANFSLTELGNIQLVNPSEEIIDKFNDIVHNLIKEKDILRDNSQTLSSLKDTLLPKLLSGEIDLTNNQKEVVNG